MLTTLINVCKSLVTHVKNKLKQLTRPNKIAITTGLVTDLSRSKADLLVENALLRQQLIVLNRQVKRPKFTNRDRLKLITLSRLTIFWQSALHIIQPDTLLRWHRDLFRLYWRRKSKAGNRQPRIPQETIDLIKQMARENQFWGAEKIRGELLKLGIQVGKPTIQKYMRQVRRRSGQNWRNFLKNHAQDIWACDFMVVHDLLFRPIYIFIVIAHQTREIMHTAVTRHPTDEWVAQQLREATPWGNKPKYLIRDNDGKYGKLFSAVARNSGIKEIKTPVAAPRANAICERFVGSIRRECLDHFFILHERQLSRIVQRYVSYYDQARPHQGIAQQIPVQFAKPRSPTSNQVKGKVVAIPVLNGLHHHYAYKTHTH